MVAFAENTEAYADSPPRARGQDRRHIFGDSLRDKPNESIEPRSTSYTGNARLGSCSRDPIGYEGSEWSLYQYVVSNPLRWIDPAGLCPKDCGKIYKDLIDAINDQYNKDLERIRDETRNLAVALTDTASWMFEQSMKDAESVRQQGVARCNGIDDSTWLGAAERGGCIAIVNTAFTVACGAAATELGLATAKTAAAVAAFQAGQFVGLQLFVTTAKAAAWDAKKECEGRGFGGPKL